MYMDIPKRRRRVCKGGLLHGIGMVTKAGRILFSSEVLLRYLVVVGVVAGVVQNADESRCYEGAYGMMDICVG